MNPQSSPTHLKTYKSSHVYNDCCVKCVHVHPVLLAIITVRVHLLYSAQAR